jgi:spore coat protein U-like protein
MKNNNFKISAIIICLSLLSLINKANAVSTAMTVSAAIAPVCNLQAPNIPLGNYNQTAPGSTYNTVNISIICTKNTTASLKIDAGQYSDGTSRYMMHTNGIDKLKYRLIDGATYLDIPINTIYTSIAGLGTQQYISLSASIPPKQNIPAGNYSDTIVFSIEY